MELNTDIFKTIALQARSAFQIAPLDSQTSNPAAQVRKAASSKTRKTTLLKTSLRHGLLTFALLSAAVPAWCAKEAPVATTPKTVNINTADAATLADVLKGVGLAKAEAIIAYRKEHGGFKSVEQLADVKGIGDKLVKANQDRIVVK
jgi:competence protein ComEA